MKIVTFQRKNSATSSNRFRIGAIREDGTVADLTALRSNSDLNIEELLDCLDNETGFLENALSGIQDATSFDRSEVRLCAPVPRPGKVICIGLNYRDHAEESGMAIPTSPIIFSKFSGCVVAVDDPIRIPAGSSQVDYEAELAFVIGKRAKNVRAARSMEHVLGYTNFNDVSARDFQFADGQWQRGKSCDTFAPMGEFIATTDEISDPHDLRISFRLNCKTLQDSNTGQLIFKIPELIEFLSRYITLDPGDVVATGTPPGVGFARTPPIFMKDGDVAEVEIEGLGVLSNPVIA
jgi:2-keto-4-pentenoate hydratase/2-oxohepta-3-ene-1,7-dioic acid hydratase in catechol pathway